MKTIVVLAMHGMPPTDYPKKELAEFFRLHSIVEGIGRPISEEVQSQYAILHQKLRDWPRNSQNDPFKIASEELAKKLMEISGYPVLVGYNEFCSPSLDEVLLTAVHEKANKIVVVTPMMTRGGEHAEKDIPLKIDELKNLYPKVEIIYAWPFDNNQIAHFLSEHISRFS